MTAVPLGVTGEVEADSAAAVPTPATPGSTAPAFALYVTVDPAAGPAATALLAEVARRVLAAVEEQPLTRSRSLLAVTPTGRLSRAVARVGEELAAVDPPTHLPAAVRAEAAWSVPQQAGPSGADGAPASIPPFRREPAAPTITTPPGTPTGPGTVVPQPRPARERTGLVLDADAREVTRGGVVVPMTHKELGLLEHLLRNPHRAVPRDELLQQVWRKNVTARTTRTIDVHVRRLREKLGGSLRIVTVRGVGYRWDPTPDVVLIGSGDAE
jgi:hypothetical protein